MFRNAVLAFAVAAGVLCTRPAFSADAATATKWVAYGQQQYAARQYDKAVQAFSTAAKYNSGDAAAWKGLGNALYAKRDYANALKYYKYALQLSPNDTQLATFVQRLAAATQNGGASADPVALAARYYQARQYDFAIQQYNAALARNPNNDKAYQGLGNCYYAKGNKPQAVNAYKRALQVNPNNTGLKAFLARYAPEAAQASGVQVASGPKDWTDPLWRSAVLPGWGQSFNGETTKGWILGGLTIATLVGTVGTYIVGDAARSNYQNFTGTGNAAADQSTEDGYYNTWDQMAQVNNILALSFLALYTFNLVDAIIDAKPETHAIGLAPGEEPPVQLGMLSNGLIGAKVQLLKF
jgi:tetratricopeptide (TPR) repeat protein